MSVPGRDTTTGRAPAGPLPSRTPAVCFDDALVVDALGRLARAASRAAACDAVLPLLLEVEGVRAAAVVLRDGARVLIVGSAGYGCGPMSVGAELPLDTGLPVTEAVRTGRDVVQGSGPSWVAVPFAGRAGALLLSLTAAPPPELARLKRIVRGLDDALARTGVQERAAADVAAVTARLAPPSLTGVTVRCLPHDGPVGGDIALCLPDGHGGRWLVVADVAGSGLAAAVVACSVSATFSALLDHVDGPGGLLTAAARVLPETVGDGMFVTALVAHERDGRLRVASAGHPPLLVATASEVTAVDVEPGLPLALEGARPTGYREAEVVLADDAVLLLHSDGLADRRTVHGPQAADVAALVAERPLDDLEALADAVLAAAEEVGAQGDDITLVLARPLR